MLISPTRRGADTLCADASSLLTSEVPQRHVEPRVLWAGADGSTAISLVLEERIGRHCWAAKNTLWGCSEMSRRTSRWGMAGDSGHDMRAEVPLSFVKQDNCFTILNWPLPHITVNQPQVYMCPLPAEPPPASHPISPSRWSQSTGLSSPCHTASSHYFTYGDVYDVYI